MLTSNVQTERVLHNPRLLTFILAHGADPNVGVTGRGQRTALARNGGRPINMATSVTSLGRKHSYESLDILLQHGARFELTNVLHWQTRRDGDTWTSKGERVEPQDSFDRRCAQVQQLLDRGLDVNAKGDVALWFSHSIGPTRIVEATPLDLAFMRRDWRFAEWLLERGRYQTCTCLGVMIWVTGSVP